MTELRKQVIGEYTSSELDQLLMQGWVVKKILNRHVLEVVYECILEKGAQPTDLQEGGH